MSNTALHEYEPLRITARSFDAAVATTLRLIGKPCRTFREVLSELQAVARESGLSEADQAVAEQHLWRMFEQAEDERKSAA